MKDEGPKTYLNSSGSAPLGKLQRLSAPMFLPLVALYRSFPSLCGSVSLFP